MNPEKQRRTILEACGKWHSGWPHQYMNQSDRLRHIPDYLNDLNAMHEVEKTLTDKAHEEFRLNLYEMLGDDSRLIVSATAAQRAEAFLRTIGKWEEEK